MTFLLDTNVLVYPHDEREVEKGRRAGEVLRTLAVAGQAALSAQALAEFANVTLRKLKLPIQEVFEQLEDLSKAFPVLPLSEWVVLEALRGVKDHAFSYYDAQVWAAAKLHQLPVVLSEDFSSGATVEGVTFLNPFGKDFDLSLLG
ncbi:PIN domain nuclease [soil metagenome]